MSGAAGSSQWMYATGYEVGQSLRFDNARGSGADSPFLSRTFVTPTNRKKFTFSVWLKRSVFGAYPRIFSTATGAGGNTDNINFMNDDTLRFISDFGQLTTTQVFRDPSAWYHIMYAFDSTQGTAANRLKLYVNGTQVTSFGTAQYPDENDEVDFNSAIVHDIGRNAPEAGQNMDGYMADVNFIDGAALTPASFGETGDYGEWKPIEYSGTYGNNGFYLPFKHTPEVSSGFSITNWLGDNNDSSNGRYIGGVGFSYDLIWIKDRDASRRHFLTTSNIGYNKNLQPDSDAQQEAATDRVEGQHPDGLTIGHRSEVNHAGNRFVAWAWDMSQSGETSNDSSATGIGSVDSTHHASTTYGQSVVTYTASSGACTVAHGLSSAPEMIWYKVRDADRDWSVYHIGANGGTNPEQYALRLNTDAAAADVTDFNDTAPTSTVFSDKLTDTTSSTQVMCFHSVTGYSKVGSYTGNATDGKSISLGFKAAFVMIKRTDAANDWLMIDKVRVGETDGKSSDDNELHANATIAEQNDERLEFDDDGFNLKSTAAAINANNGNYIYYAVADNREYAFYKDQSGNNNDFISHNLTESDVMLDTPSNNFPTLNPLGRPGFGDGDARGLATLTSSALRFDTVASQDTYLAAPASIDLGSSGKWYAEFYCDTHAGNGSLALGITFDFPLNFYLSHQPGEDDNTWGYNSAGSVTNNNSAVSGTYASYGKDDIVQIAVDLDNDKFYVAKNNSWQEQDPANGNGISISAYAGKMCMITCGATNANQKAGTWNFGQDSSFSGRRTPQANGSYDFFYAPPTGYQAICTKELPAVIKPKENFNVLTYTGTGSSNAQTAPGITGGVDFLWTKCRSHTKQHILVDDIRGGNNNLMSDSSEAENNNANRSITLGDNSFTLNSDSGHLNENSKTYVSWMWKANGSGSSNTTGDINSTVSANAAAGFSIVSYTGNGSADQTVGHGLSKAPEWILVKNRVDDDNWCVFVNSSSDTNLNNTSDATDFLRLDTNIATGDDADRWNDTVPTTSVFTVDTDNQVNGDGNAMIAYCFHDVDGYAKVGAYRATANATHGPFVHCGFRPAFIMIKQVSNAGSWYMYDQEREGYNVDNDSLVADATSVEATDNDLDILSNGFKIRTAESERNASGQRFFFYAVAEFPLKFANAR